MVWGPVADKLGRVKALMMTILFYSVFTFMCGLVTTIWQLAILRVLCGIGLGGEQPMGGTFVAEEWPEDRRKMGAGLMHTGYYFGFFIAALANYIIGANYGWRWMFIFGGLPALLVSWIRVGVHEPETWKKQAAATAHRSAIAPFAELFAPHYLRRTIVAALLFTVSIIGLWAGSIYIPAAVTQIAVREGYAAADAARMASYGAAILAVGTIIGCLIAPWLAERLGRRLVDGQLLRRVWRVGCDRHRLASYLPAALQPFFVLIFFMGLGGANFAIFTLWLPEQVRDQLPRKRHRVH